MDFVDKIITAAEVVPTPFQFPLDHAEYTIYTEYLLQQLYLIRCQILAEIPPASRKTADFPPELREKVVRGGIFLGLLHECDRRVCSEILYNDPVVITNE